MLNMKKNMPLVSMIVPCYNHEKYIQETIESIISQTYNNVELIVIDDGSKDNSPSILQELSRKHNFKFIHRPNKGLSATLNESIGLSQGKYFSVCASDDILILDKIEKQVNFMENHPKYGMCYGKIIRFNDNSLEKKVKIKNAKSGWIFNDIITAKISIPAVSTMVKTDIIKDVGKYDEELWIEDWDMWLRIAEKYEIGYMDDYLAYYRQHDTNISKQSLKMYKAQKNILAKWKQHKDYLKILEIWENKWFYSLSKNYKQEAKKYLYVALRNIHQKQTIKALVRYFLLKEEE